MSAPCGGVESWELRVEELARGFIHMQLDFFLCELLRDFWEEFWCDGFVHEQCFHGVTDGGTLDFCVHGDFFGHFQIGIRIHKNVANAFVMLDDWHA